MTKESMLKYVNLVASKSNLTLFQKLTYTFMAFTVWTCYFLGLL